MADTDVTQTIITIITSDPAPEDPGAPGVPMPMTVLELENFWAALTVRNIEDVHTDGVITAVLSEPGGFLVGLVCTVTEISHPV